MGFEYRNETILAERIRLLNEAISYLNESKEKNIESLLGEQDAYEAFYCVAHTAAFYVSRLEIDEYSNKNLELVMGNTLMELYKINEKFDFVKDKITTAISNLLPSKQLTYQQKCVDSFCLILYCTNIVGSRSLVSFCVVFVFSRLFY